MNLAHLLAKQASTRPHQAALVDLRRRPERRLTFAELEEASALAATLLHRSGLRAGDGVLVFQPMSLELYVALAALFRLGLVAMFLDPRTGKEHIEQCCRIRNPRALIASPKAHLLTLTSPALRRIPLRFSTGARFPFTRRFADWQHQLQRSEIQACVSATPALLTFTSGSTGSPKAALRTHGFLQNQQRALEESLELEAGEVELTMLPTFALANLASGVTSVITGPDLRSPNRHEASLLLRQLQDEQVNRIGAAPAFLERLAAFCRGRSITLPQIRKIYTGGGPVFPSLLSELAEIAPQARVTGIYGCTEAEPIAVLERHAIEEADQQIMASGGGLLGGHPDPALHVRIIPTLGEKPLSPWTKAEFEAQCLAPETPGEIVVSGSHVLTGYVDAAHDAQIKFRAGDTIWHRTGDAGYLDKTGRIWLLGRCCGRIEDQYGTVYPLQLEAAIRQIAPACRAALVCRGGKRLLFLERRASADLHALSGLLKSWMIEDIQLVRALPYDRRHESKIDYQALARLASKALSTSTESLWTRMARITTNWRSAPLP